LSDIERDADLRRSVPALVLAVSRVATPQIRNRGTVGGNLLQDSRCPYYRGGFDCYRAGGLECYAHHGLNYEHAVFGGDRCYTVSPSDLAPVMVALDARIHMQTAGGASSVPAHQLFVGPGDDILHMNIIHSGQVLTEIAIPVRSHQRSIFMKNAPRNAWDFSRASVAIALEMQGETCRSCRIVLGGVATTPWRCRQAEQVLKGQRLSASVITAAAKAGTSGATPLPDSDYKVPLVRQLIRDALNELDQSA
jgi:xanthine dehydrogenase YagS FAD-binding subunit